MANAIVGTLHDHRPGDGRWACRSGICAGVYLAEFGRDELIRGGPVRANVLMGVPSIVVGVFVYALWSCRMGISRGSPGRSRWRSSCCPIVARTPRRC